MSDLEKFIKKNRDAFDGAIPPEGHSERFLRKLERMEHKENQSRQIFWRIAAAVALIIVAAASVLMPNFNSPADVQYGSLSLGDISKEMSDVEFYYNSELARGYESLLLLSENDPEVKSALEELDRLSVVYKELEKQLYESGSHQAVITAMIENFRMRLELIETLEQKKNNSNNKDSI